MSAEIGATASSSVFSLLLHLNSIDSLLFQAMDVIRDCVDEKYHKCIKNGTSQGATSAVADSSMASQRHTQSGAVGGVPFPPNSNPREASGNLNKYVEGSEWYIEKLRCSSRFGSVTSPSSSSTFYPMD